MNLADIATLVDRIAANVPMNPENIGAALGTSLVRNEAGDGPVVVAFEQAKGSGGGRYESVEFRQPDPVFGKGGGLLKVVLDNANGTNAQAIIEKYGDEFERSVPSPRYPAGLPYYMTYEFPWGALSFGLTNDDDAKLVSFTMKPKAGGPAVPADTTD